jgi:hypothetical protein
MIRNKQNSIWRRVVIVVVVAFVFAGASYVKAEDATSTNFILQGTIGTFSGVSTSTSFTSFTEGQTIIPIQATSTDYSGRGGSPLGGDTLAHFVSKNWRWYGDEGNETPTGALEGENVAPPSVWDTDPIKLRLTVKEMADIGARVKFKVQYSESSDFSGSVFDVVEASLCTATSTWCYTYGAGADNATITAKVLSDADSCSASSGPGCGLHNESGTSTSDFIHTPGASSEYEFTLTASGATMHTAYFFRVVEMVGGTIVSPDTGETNPSLTTAGAELTFTIAGLPAGTSTEGIVTDTLTTAGNISFGALGLNTDKKVAQRLSIVTNAKAGYQIMLYGRQGLLNTYGDEIAPVTGVNASPLGWSSGCSVSAAGCFGYHTGDDTLESGSTRFAPNDTYAALDGVAREVAYSSVRAVFDTVDVVFRAIARGDQPAGSYESSVAYIITPVF